MQNKTTPKQKPPRVHKSHWKDTTRNTRQIERRKKLNEIAGKAGYFNKDGDPSWSAYETAVINGAVAIPPLEGKKQKGES